MTQSKTEWTPGPWWIQFEASRNGRWVKSADGQDVAEIILTNPANHTHVNARLIKEAPTMARLLERWLDTKSDGPSVVTDTQAVLARIRG